MMAWIRTPFFFIFNFSLRFAAFGHSRKGVKQKAKAKAEAKSNCQLGPSFSLPRCAFLVMAYFLSSYLSNWPAISFFFQSWPRQPSGSGSNFMC
jgi:hypothetical protein